MFNYLLQSLIGFENVRANDSILQNGIQEMLEQKATVKKIALAANEKPKAFFAKVKERFIDGEAVSKSAAKVLLYSRLVEIDKIAEIIGGKDKTSLDLVDAYLDRQDFSKDIEGCLRSFMQTFRMAGVDSQVVFRILQSFAFKQHDKCEHKAFASQKENYEFTQLLIVL